MSKNLFFIFKTDNNILKNKINSLLISKSGDMILSILETVYIFFKCLNQQKEKPK